jgi:hypothetical protein
VPVAVGWVWVKVNVTYSDVLVQELHTRLGLSGHPVWAKRSACENVRLEDGMLFIKDGLTIQLSDSYYCTHLLCTAAPCCAVPCLQVLLLSCCCGCRLLPEAPRAFSAAITAARHLQLPSRCSSS